MIFFITSNMRLIVNKLRVSSALDKAACKTNEDIRRSCGRWGSAHNSCTANQTCEQSIRSKSIYWTQRRRVVDARSIVYHRNKVTPNILDSLLVYLVYVTERAQYTAQTPGGDTETKIVLQRACKLKNKSRQRQFNLKSKLDNFRWRNKGKTSLHVVQQTAKVQL